MTTTKQPSRSLPPREGFSRLTIEWPTEFVAMLKYRAALAGQPVSYWLREAAEKKLKDEDASRSQSGRRRRGE